MTHPTGINSSIGKDKDKLEGCIGRQAVVSKTMLNFYELKLIFVFLRYWKLTNHQILIAKVSPSLNSNKLGHEPVNPPHTRLNWPPRTISQICIIYLHPIMIKCQSSVKGYLSHPTPNTHPWKLSFYLKVDRSVYVSMKNPFYVDLLNIQKCTKTNPKP